MGPEGSNLKLSEHGQDFFVLDKVRYKRNGFFVDIGAADGVTSSNTFILEKFYTWNGICVDPNPVFTQSLFNVRDCFASTLCVYNKTGEILPFKFCSADNQFFGWNFRSGLTNHFQQIDQQIDKTFSEINVLTISLNDLLKLYDAPTNIDYISLDTEGSEYEILKSFDFEMYNVSCFTIEFSNEEEREKIFLLMTENGYQLDERILPNELWFFKITNL